MDSGDRELFEDSIRAALRTRDVDAALAELGWAEALEEYPETAVPALFSLQGEAGASSSGLDQLLRWKLGVDVPVLLPRLGSATAPGAGGGLLLGSMAPAAAGGGGPTGGSIALVAAAGPGHVLTVVPTEGLTLRPVQGIDPALGLIEVSGDGTGVSSGGDPVDWDGAVRLARLALAHELLGASRAMLGLAREHALTRIQFGHPIAQFQAVRHKLADVLIAVEMAEGVLAAAWLDGNAQTATMARSLAGRAARLAAKHCQQVLAGIGFTLEHTLHTFIRRVWVLEELFGPARTLSKQLGAQILAERSLPELLPL